MRNVSPLAALLLASVSVGSMSFSSLPLLGLLVTVPSATAIDSTVTHTYDEFWPDSGIGQPGYGALVGTFYPGFIYGGNAEVYCSETYFSFVRQSTLPCAVYPHGSFKATITSTASTFDTFSADFSSDAVEGRGMGKNILLSGYNAVGVPVAAGICAAPVNTHVRCELTGSRMTKIEISGDPYYMFDTVTFSNLAEQDPNQPPCSALRYHVEGGTVPTTHSAVVQPGDTICLYNKGPGSVDVAVYTDPRPLGNYLTGTSVAVGSIAWLTAPDGAQSLEISTLAIGGADGYYNIWHPPPPCGMATYHADGGLGWPTGPTTHEASVRGFDEVCIYNDGPSTVNVKFYDGMPGFSQQIGGAFLAPGTKQWITAPPGAATVEFSVESGQADGHYQIIGSGDPIQGTGSGACSGLSTRSYHASSSSPPTESADAIRPGQRLCVFNRGADSVTVAIEDEQWPPNTLVSWTVDAGQSMWSGDAPTGATRVTFRASGLSTGEYAIA